MTTASIDPRSSAAAAAACALRGLDRCGDRGVDLGDAQHGPAGSAPRPRREAHIHWRSVTAAGCVGACAISAMSTRSLAMPVGSANGASAFTRAVGSLPSLASSCGCTPSHCLSSRPSTSASPCAESFDPVAREARSRKIRDHAQSRGSFKQLDAQRLGLVPVGRHGRDGRIAVFGFGPAARGALQREKRTGRTQGPGRRARRPRYPASQSVTGSDVGFIGMSCRRSVRGSVRISCLTRTIARRAFIPVFEEISACSVQRSVRE